MTPFGSPPARAGHAYVWTGRELIIAGGSTGGDANVRRDVWAFAPKQGWRRLPDLPEGRNLATAVWTPTRLLLIGGQDTTGPRAGGYGLSREVIELEAANPRQTGQIKKKPRDS